MSIVIALMVLIFLKQFLCFIFNKIECVTGLLFMKYMVFLPLKKLSRVMSELDFRGGRGVALVRAHSPSMWPGFRSWYIRVRAG